VISINYKTTSNDGQNTLDCSRLTLKKLSVTRFLMVILFKSNLKRLIARTGSTTVLFSVVVKLISIKKRLYLIITGE
jgi:hypothetical protein